jgi:hypothetical protein
MSTPFYYNSSMTVDRKELENSTISNNPGAQTGIRTKQEAMQKETHDAVLSAEGKPRKRASFDEAKSLLSNHQIFVGGVECRSLKEVLKTIVRRHQQSGFIEALKQFGINTPDQYGALLSKATVDETDLLTACMAIESGKKVLPLFDAGIMISPQLFNAVVVEGGVPHQQVNLEGIRKINPKHISGLEDLHNKSKADQCAALMEAYRKAPPQKPTGPRLIFTSNRLEMTPRGTSTTQDLQALAKGGPSPLDLNANILRYGAQIDEGVYKIAHKYDIDCLSLSKEDYKNFLRKIFANEEIYSYLPDIENFTRCPDEIFENGYACHLIFQIFDDKKKDGLYIAKVPPSWKDKGKSRIALG